MHEWWRLNPRTMREDDIQKSLQLFGTQLAILTTHTDTTNTIIDWYQKKRKWIVGGWVEGKISKRSKSKKVNTPDQRRGWTWYGCDPCHWCLPFHRQSHLHSVSEVEFKNQIFKWQAIQTLLNLHLKFALYSYFIPQDKLGSPLRVRHHHHLHHEGWIQRRMC